jgi:hypothetical protein
VISVDVLLQTLSQAAEGAGLASPTKTANAMWSPRPSPKDLDFWTLAGECIDFLQAVFLPGLNQAVRHRPSVRVPLCLAPNQEVYRHIVAHPAIGGSRTIAARNHYPARHSRRAGFQPRRLIRNFRFALRMRTNISPFASARNRSCLGSKAKDPVVRHTAFAGAKKPFLYFTHWVLTSGASLSRSHPHKY